MITENMKEKLRILARDVGYIAIFTPTEIKLIDGPSMSTFENSKAGHQAAEAMLHQGRKQKTDSNPPID